MARSFVEEFEVKEEEIRLKDVPDYEAFTNKKLLDELRNKIIQNLIDNNTNNQISMASFVRKQIDKSLEFLSSGSRYISFGTSFSFITLFSF